MSEALPPGWATALLGEFSDINPKHPKGLNEALPVSFVPMAAVSETKPGVRVHGGTSSRRGSQRLHAFL